MPGHPDQDPGPYRKISQCVLARERATLAGTKVQLTGKLLRGSNFCHRIRKADISTEDYLCFALGEPCIIRLYLHNEHPDAALLSTLEDGDEVTAFGTFDYLGSDYNYVIVERLSVGKP